MNKLGQSIMMGVIVGIGIFVVGVLLINFFKPEITQVRASTQLDCSNAAGISDGNKLACLVVDLVVPYFIVIFISLAGGVMTERFLT